MGQAYGALIAALDTNGCWPRRKELPALHWKRRSSESLSQPYYGAVLRPRAATADPPASAADSTGRTPSKQRLQDHIGGRVEARSGRLGLSGRYHVEEGCLPRRLEEDYRVTRTVLGRGYNGNVMLAQGRGATHDQWYALKELNLDSVPDSARAALEAEVEVFLSIDHPHIVRLVNVFETDQRFHVVMECLEGGELLERLLDRGTFAERDAAEAMRQMLLAVNYLHTLNIVHRDLKPENFLYDARGSNHLKLIDFGFSKIWEPSEKMEHRCGTLSYCAPEVLLKTYTSRCDLWSLGVIGFLLLSGHMPFGGASDLRTEEAIMSGSYHWKPEHWVGISDDAQDFVAALLTVSPDERPSASSALCHPWIAGAYRDAVPDVDAGVVEALRDFALVPKFRRACLWMMAWCLTNEQRARVRQHFLHIGTSREGTISLDELSSVMRDKLQSSGEEIHQTFEALDSNQDHRIHYSDFLAAMAVSSIEVHEHLMRDVFNRFDTDRSGYITAKNLCEVFGADGGSCEVAEFIAEADVEHDGRISFPEFSQYVRGGAGKDNELGGEHATLALGREAEPPSDCWHRKSTASTTDDDATLPRLLSSSSTLSHRSGSFHVPPPFFAQRRPSCCPSEPVQKVPSLPNCVADAEAGEPQAFECGLGAVANLIAAQHVQRLR